jgi:hypothetical protein
LGGKRRETPPPTETPPFWSCSAADECPRLTKKLVAEAGKYESVTPTLV